MSKLKGNEQANITPFNVMINGEEWNIFSQWVNSDGEVVWYDAKIIRNGVEFSKYFSPEEVVHDQKD